VPRHGIDGNKTADHLARQSSPFPLTGPEPALGISEKIVRGVIRGFTSGKHKEYWHSIHGQRQATGFLKRPCAIKSWGITQLEQEPSKNNDGTTNRML
jgi:hypothetical protein